MSPPNARVFVIEDDLSWQASIAYALGKEGHTVAISARTKEEALAVIPQLRTLGVQVATLDGRLRSEDRTGEDVGVILDNLRDQIPELKIIGLAGGAVPGVDIDLKKDNIKQLAKVVTTI